LRDSLTHVVIKIIRKSKLDQIDLESVRNEVEIMKDINHKNIVKILNSFENFEYIYIISEYFENSMSLVDYIKKFDYNIEDNKINAIIKKIFEAIEFLHKRSILCRNIKTENFLITHNLDIKMNNFRLSRILGVNQVVNHEPYGAMVVLIN